MRLIAPRRVFIQRNTPTTFSLFTLISNYAFFVFIALCFRILRGFFGYRFERQKVNECSNASQMLDAYHSGKPV
jgi:hypothetical protein